MLLQGLSEKQIARELGLSPHTVHAYVKSLHKEFGAASRGELLAICYRMLLDDARRSAPAAGVVVEPPAVRRLRVRFTAVLRREVGEAVHQATYSPGC